jgi:hypothetical protein
VPALPGAGAAAALDRRPASADGSEAMNAGELESALVRERARARDLLRRLQATTARAIEAEEALASAEADRDRYARLYAQAEAARMALAGEGPLAVAPAPGVTHG